MIIQSINFTYKNMNSLTILLLLVVAASSTTAKSIQQLHDNTRIHPRQSRKLIALVPLSLITMKPSTTRNDLLTRNNLFGSNNISTGKRNSNMNKTLELAFSVGAFENEQFTSSTSIHSTTRSNNNVINSRCCFYKENTKSKKYTKTNLFSINRGGSGDGINTIKNDEGNNKKDIKKLITYGIPIAILLTILGMNKDAISSFNFKGELASQLDALSSMGNKGLITYIVAFMIWEMVVGVTTPVETAAGMAFGLKRGIVANAIGKTSGAIFAFLLGRFVLRDYVSKKLQDNEYMDLVKESILKNPVRVALIWRFSFLPEQIKNFGLAILPVKTWHFIAAVLLHGFPFTLLWTFMGNEMGMLLKGIVAEPRKILKVLIGFVYVLGFFISPSMVGLWIKGLRDQKMKQQ